MVFKVCNLHICPFESFIVPRGQSLLTVLALVQEELPRFLKGRHGPIGPPLANSRTTLLVLWPISFILKAFPPFN
jgi:hypothetical protein